ncbi:MAG: creatininase family protein [candidate division Zixibacteria bacterium]|nr:creatininase family protein [candidate division Zixibacteria bacterium]
MSSTTSKRSYRLEHLTWQEFGELVPKSSDTILLPVGTIEAHGVAPLGTDNLIPEALAERLAPYFNAVIAPCLPYGITKSLLTYPGSLTVSSASFESYVSDLIDSMTQQGFKKIVILNGHGGQNEELRRAASKVHRATGACIAVIHWWMLCEEVTQKVFGQAGGHAGLDETACILAIDRNLVKKNRYNRSMAYTFKDGVYALPAPGTILLYREGEGYPDFDEKKANLYLQKVVEKVKLVLEEIFAKWEQKGIRKSISKK